MILPDLPPNQRWSVRREQPDFILFRLQERRWWGWRTITERRAWAAVAGDGFDVCERMLQASS